MTAAMGVGAVIGGLLVAARGQDRAAAAGAGGVRLRRRDGCSPTLAPSLPLELVALAFAGGASISFMASGNSTLQLERRARRCAAA